MPSIRLPGGVWMYDDSTTLGPAGGFGEVFIGRCVDREIAIKKLHVEVEDDAHRELEIADVLKGNDYRHVIPVFDAGQDVESSSYFVVMAKAERSLADEIETRDFTPPQAAEILLEIATGLKEAQHIVHRDLKPGNVLFHEGRWKLADFGIARLAEAATSSQTLKGCWSSYYAAPEQWLLKRATNATDIYALGCIAFELLTGDPPFLGSDEDLRDQHLHSSAPQISTVPRDSRLCTLVLMMLRKEPRTRPGTDRVIEVLKGIIGEPAQTKATGAQSLADVGEAIAKRESVEDARQQSLKATAKDRVGIARTAYAQLRNISIDLCAAALASAPAATRKRRGKSITVESIEVVLGVGALVLEMETKHVHSADEFSLSGWNVLASGAVGVTQKQPPYEWWSSLWFTDLGEKDSDLRWYEVSYFASPLLPERAEYQPFQLSHQPKNADEAAAPVIGTNQIAFGPTPIDDENQQEFFDRWMMLFARAAKGELAHPRELPIKTI